MFETNSPFINQNRSWDDDEFFLSEELKKGLIEELNYQKPSHIQTVAIPLIVKTDYE